MGVTLWPFWLHWKQIRALLEKSLLTWPDWPQQKHLEPSKWKAPLCGLPHLARRPQSYCPLEWVLEALGLLAQPTTIWTCSSFHFVWSPNSTSCSRAFLIMSFRVLHPEKLKNSLISSVNISWYLVFLISSSSTYCGSNNALSLNLAVISTTVSIVWRRSWNSLANYCTSIPGANSLWKDDHRRFP